MSVIELFAQVKELIQTATILLLILIGLQCIAIGLLIAVWRRL